MPRWLQRAFSPGWVDLLDAGVLMLLVSKELYDLGCAHDVLLNDEATYIASGTRLLIPGFPNDARGLPVVDYGPLYTFWYRFLSWFCGDRVSLGYLNQALLVFAIIGASYTLLRVLGAGPLFACASAFFISTIRVLDVEPYQVHFVTVALLVGAAAVARAETWDSALRRASVTLVVVTFVRPEFFVAYLAFTAAAGVFGVRALARHRLSLRAFAANVLAHTGPAGVLVAIFGSPINGERSIYAFGQHYALNVVNRTHENLDPWTNWGLFLERDFGPVRTVGQALRANPTAFVRHVEDNLARLPSALSWAVDAGGVWPEAAKALSHAFFFALVTGCVLALRRSSAGGWWRARTSRAVLCILVPSVITTAIAVIVIFPRGHYFVPDVTLVLVVVAAVAARGWRSVLSTQASSAWRPVAFAFLWTGAFLLTSNHAYGWTPGWPSESDQPGKCSGQEGRGIIELLRRLPLPQRIVIMEPAWGYAFYAGHEFEWVGHYEKQEAFSAYLRRKNLDVLVINRLVLSDGRFRDDPEFAAFLVDPEKLGYRIFPVPESDAVVAVREALLSNR